MVSTGVTFLKITFQEKRMEEEEYLGETPKQPRPFVIASNLWQAWDTLVNLDDR